MAKLVNENCSENYEFFLMIYIYIYIYYFSDVRNSWEGSQSYVSYDMAHIGVKHSNDQVSHKRTHIEVSHFVCKIIQNVMQMSTSRIQSWPGKKSHAIAGKKQRL